jgi:hypothetical protein
MDYLPGLAGLALIVVIVGQYALVERPRLKRKVEDARFEALCAQIEVQGKVMDARLVSVEQRLGAVEQQLATFRALASRR